MMATLMSWSVCVQMVATGRSQLGVSSEKHRNIALIRSFLSFFLFYSGPESLPLQWAGIPHLVAVKHFFFSAFQSILTHAQLLSWV